MVEPSTARDLAQVDRHHRFTSEYLDGQTPWFGPYLSDRYRMRVSTSGLGLAPGVDYRATLWLFDEGGAIVSEAEVGECAYGRGITVDITEAVSVGMAERGMLALLLRPIGLAPAEPITEAWTLRLIDDTGLAETVTSEAPPRINAAGPTGKRSTFRLVSTQLVDTDGWRSVITVSNPSSDPLYRKSITLRTLVFNARGDSLSASPLSVPAFGTAFLDLVDVFGDELAALLARTGGRGSCRVASDDGAAIGYHFLCGPSGQIAADHTRPMARYLRSGYGTSRYATDTSFPFRLAALGQNVACRVSRGRYAPGIRSEPRV